MKVKCSQLGIEDCDFVAEGETAGDVVKKVVKHLRSEHQVDMPDADLITEGRMEEEPLEMADPAAKVVVERLTKALDIVPEEESEMPEPSIGRTISS
jgi:predicted small metal-binding protein